MNPDGVAAIGLGFYFGFYFGMVVVALAFAFGQWLMHRKGRCEHCFRPLK